MNIWKRLAMGALSVMMLFSSAACVDTENVEGDHQHKTVRRAGITPTCQKTGKLEYWECIIDGCGKLFADSACTQEISKTDITLPKAQHTLTNHAKVEATETDHGNIEYWTCDICTKYFSDDLGKNEITQADTVDPSLISLVDFLVTVPDDRDAVILQLADPQIIDSDQKREDSTLNDKMVEMWKWDEEILQARCYNYITEIVENTNPDLILLSGDIIYGAYDDNGRVLEDFVRFMETLDVKWAPVMGNHDVESAKGADWQCKQYENASNCLFKQGDVMGNGNYTIGIKQGGELRRVIVNMDTNGCTGASQASINNGQTVHHGNNSYGTSFGTYGLQTDQVLWFNNTVSNIQKFVPDVKISFHFHIAPNAFSEAYNEEYKDLVGTPVASVNAGKFGDAVSNKVLYPERVIGHREGDIGTLLWLWQGGKVPDFWDTAGVHGATDNTIFNKIKALGTDSIFVGHYHSNSVSIMHDGIRFQFGQKCSTYDTTQIIYEDGTISSGNVYYKNGVATDYAGNASFTPLVGGTVNPMDKDTGELKNPYIYYCAGAGKEVDWAQYKNTIG